MSINIEKTSGITPSTAVNDNNTSSGVSRGKGIVTPKELTNVKPMNVKAFGNRRIVSTNLPNIQPNTQN